jgi:hypothetical protein
MARKRKKNPETESLKAGVDNLIATSANALDLAYEEHKELDSDIRTLERIKMQMKEDGHTFPSDARSKLRALKARKRELERRFDLYIRITVKDMKARIAKIEKSPIASLRSEQIKKLNREVFQIERKARRGGADLRHELAHAMGGVKLLEEHTGEILKEGPRKKSKAEEKKEALIGLVPRLRKRWGQIRKHAVKHSRLYLPGSEVAYKEKGKLKTVAKIIDFDGRKMTLRFDRGADKKVGMDKAVPAPIVWVDRQIKALEEKVSDGEDIAKVEIQRVADKMKSIHNLTKQRSKLQTYSEANRALESMIGKIQNRLAGDKMDKAEVEKFLLELEELQTRIPSTAKAQWPPGKPREFASNFRSVRKALVKLRRKANPCIGLHFHGKDADELLAAVEKSNARQRKKVAKKNPSRKPKKVGGFTVIESGEKSVTLSRGLERIQVSSIKGRRQSWAKPYRDAGVEYAFAYVPDISNERDGVITPLPKSTSLSGAVRDAVKNAGKSAKKNPSSRKRNPGLFKRFNAAEYKKRVRGLSDKQLTKEFKSSRPMLQSKETEKQRAKIIYNEAMRRGMSSGLHLPARLLPDLLENPKKKVSKKKVSKKKATRKKTPPYQLLINRCQKLWDHYCERPSKTRLKPVLEHLEKMKASTSKKVADERKSCLRVANKEARRLKMK